MTGFLCKDSIVEKCQCKKNLIGIAAYHKNKNTNPIVINYSETLTNTLCDGQNCRCDYVDIFGVMLVKLATRLTDISMCDLYISSIDNTTGEYIDPIANNKAAIRLLVHVGVTTIFVKTEDSYIRYNKQALLNLL